MKNRTYALMLLLCTAALSMTACGDKTPSQDADASPAPTVNAAPTDAAAGDSENDDTASEKVTYEAKDKSFTIDLPNKSWKMALDDGHNAVFNCEGTGSITVIRMADKSEVTIPSDEKSFMENLVKSGKAEADYEILNFHSQPFTDNIGWYKYVMKCNDDAEGYSYASTYIIATAKEVYSVTGLIKADDTQLLDTVTDSVNSFIFIISPEGSSEPEATETPAETAAPEEAETPAATPAEETPSETPAETPAPEEPAPTEAPASPSEPEFAYSESFPIYDANGNESRVYLSNDDWEWHSADGTHFNCEDHTLTDEHGNVYYYDISDVP